MNRLALNLTLCAVCTVAAVAQQPLNTANNPPYKNPALSVETRVNDLVSRMTLEEKVSQMETAAKAIPRLDIPYYNFWNEAAHGVCCAGYATVFPQVIGLAATFDTPLVHQIGEVASIEGRAKYNDKLRQPLRSSIARRRHG
jgi:beta-glucosidase